ncbi:MAG: hypothetical protein Q8Q67_00010 [bacterium]|nr:hypothetical protein [bacterium]
MEWELVGKQLSGLAYVLLAISPAIFVFAVTLLGTAIEKSQNEEKAARENAKTDAQIEIDEVETALKKARQDGDTTSLTAKLEALKIKKSSAEKEISNIRNKYKRINLLNTVIIPCVLFILVITLNLSVFISENIIFRFTISIIQILLIFIGVWRLYRSLQLIQIISANKKESDQYHHLKEAIKVALNEHKQDNQEEAIVQFVDKAFPLNVVASMELEINFRAKLIKGSTLKNAFVWFYVPDGFELIRPPEASSWRQPSLENIRTVQISLNTLSIGPATPRSLKIKTPSAPGKYTIKYAVRAEGYYGESKDIAILVG